MIDGIHLELAAAGFFTLLFLVNYLKKQLPSQRKAVFQLLLCAMMLTVYFKAGSDLVGYYGGSDIFHAAMQTTALYFEALCFLFFYFYLRAYTYSLYQKREQMLPVAVLFTVVTVCILSSPWTDLCFTIGKNGVIYQGPLSWFIFAIVLWLVCRAVYVTWINRREYTTKRFIMYILLLAGLWISAVLEALRPKYSGIFEMCLVFFMYAFYLSLQNPDFYVDNATGAFNRNGFLEIFRERISYHKETSCFLVRVRNFYSMNQIYSEDVLRTVQRQMREVLERHAQKGTVYHIGASTFAVIFSSEKETLQMYGQIKNQMPSIWNVGRETVSVEYSFYQLSYPEDGEDGEELIQRIHYARSDHENHHKAGELIRLRHDTVAQAEEKKKVAHLLEEAVMDNSLELHFQPIYSIQKDCITSLEVLSRLKDEKKQYINPEFFIHVAEENHTIIPLGEQIFRKACIFADKNNIFEYGIEDININLSPAQCRYEGLKDSLVKIAGQYHIPMERVHFEITESEFQDKEAVGRTLKRLKETGAKVALDDFGTGSSMLSNILELPVDYVKIDKSLVWSFAEGKNQFLNDLMPLICAEGKKIIAEGIETKEHIEIIKKLSGDFLQGFYFSKPLPEEQFMSYLKKFRQK